MLTVYKASAGSGKTFQLVVAYLKLILEDPTNYKHILAVTFTNKATNEMKSRILEQLHKLANNEVSAYIKPLQEEKGYTEQFVRERAREVLKNILHDYNRFSISTIDSFTQRVIKSFNRELGISPNFTLELDTDIILEEAIERLFAKIGNDKELLNWLRDYSREKIEENRSQRLDYDIQSLGKEIFKERFQVFFTGDGELAYRRDNLDAFVKELHQIRHNFLGKLKDQGLEAVQAMENAGLSPADFSGGASKSVGAYLVKLSNGDLPNFTKTLREAAEDSEKWVTRNNPRREEITSIVERRIRPVLYAIINFYDSNITRYNTTLSVLKQVRTLGILIDLKEEIKELLREKGVLPISDSNVLLSRIIGESDSPFVYEKIGNYYQHFMLDEFQDTSGLQWKNFRPLLLNSLSEGHSNLIVGDVKQSIYRWRNSDWNILAEQLNADFTTLQKKDETLSSNWRSDRNIIEFNNEIIRHLLEVFESRLFNEIPDSGSYIQKFRNIYATFEQKPGKKDAEATGYIKAEFLPKDNFEELATQRLIGQVKMLQDKGIRPNETAIIVRRNREGSQIVEAFLEAAKLPENEKYQLSVLSNESLFLHASKGVMFIIHTIEYLVDPNNEITKATLLHLWMNWLKPLQEPDSRIELFSIDSTFSDRFNEALGEKMETAKNQILLSSLDETITRLASIFGLLEIKTELPFIQALIDKAGELKSQLSNDLSNLLFWWNEKGYLTSVSVNEELDSIRLLTIHGSKGLEYKAVLLPYFHWETSRDGEILWCEPKNPPFNKFPLLPIKSGTDMKASDFAAEYFDEKVSSYIDALNMVYVAVTRAKSVLMINCPKPELNKQGDYSGSGVDHLFFLAIQQLAKNAPWIGSLDAEENGFEYGDFSSGEVRETSAGSTAIEEYHFTDFSERIKLRLSGEDFLVTGSKHHSEKNLGKLVHGILSGIKTKADVDTACLRAFHAGLIDEREMETIKAGIHNNLRLPEVAPWFDGSYQILNERDLLTSERLLRPDRVMYSGGNAIVVDYKTGEKNPQKYNRQVERYAQTLKQTGFGKVSGFVWYLNSGEIEKVCEI